MRQRTMLTLVPKPDHRVRWAPPLTFLIASSSQPDVTYAVTRLASGEWTCDERCRGFKYRQHCSHIPKARLLAGEVTDVQIPEDLL